MSMEIDNPDTESNKGSDVYWDIDIPTTANATPVQAAPSSIKTCSEKVLKNLFKGSRI